MKQHVTVIPSDALIAVDGIPLWFDFAAPANLHALQWHDGAGEMEWTDDINHPLTEQDYADDIAPFVALWEAEKARLDAEANRPPTLDEVKAAKLADIKAAFAAAELFDHLLHLLKLGQQSVHILHLHTAAGGDTPLSGRIDDLRLGALLHGHRVDMERKRLNAPSSMSSSLILEPIPGNILMVSRREPMRSIWSN